MSTGTTEYFLINDNMLSGPIISTPGSLRSDNLIYFDGSNNILTVHVPEELFSQVTLEFLLLGSNFLTGTLSSSVGDFVNMFELQIERNSLEGEIPTTIGKTDLGKSLRREMK